MANTYRLIVVLGASLGDEGSASLTDTIKAKIESGATLNSLDSLGIKELAYEINGEKNG